MAYESHPTQKPIKISKRILTLCVLKYENLLIPFIDSGTEMVTVLQYGMNVYGLS